MASVATAVKVDRQELLNALQSVSPGLASKEIIEQSTSFVFKDGHVHTFNDEVCCKMPTGLPPDLTGAVHAKPLLALLEKLAEKEVGVEATGEELVVSGASRKAGVRMDAQIAMPLSSLEDPKGWKRLPEGWEEGLGIVNGCTSDNNAKFVLTCIHLTPTFMEALDNHQLVRYTVKLPLSRKFLVRGASVAPAAGLGVTHVGEGQSWLHFKNKAGLVYSCRVYLDEFPDLDGFLEVKGGKVTLPGGLSEAVEKAEIFSKENAASDKVLVKLAPGKLVVRGEGALGWFRETIKFKYAGEPLSFLIRPKLLADITKRFQECVLNPDRLMVEGERYKYVTSLLREQKNDGEGE